MSIDKNFENHDKLPAPDKPREFSSSVSSVLSALYLKNLLEKGKDISIPSLGITICAKDYNGKIYDK